METGQKIIQTNNKIEQSNNLVLSIQVSLNGLSFCILNTDTKAIQYFKHCKFEKKLSPTDVLDKLVHYFNTEIALQQDFNSVKIIYANELSSFVPKPLFNKEYLADYLKFNSKILKNDYITFDEVLSNDSVNVYVPFVNINNYIYDRFGEFEFKHASTILIETILALEKHSTSAKMYVHISKFHFEIIIVENNQLKLYNTFEYKTKEDFIYYILFTAEQLELNPEEFQLILIGHITIEDKLYQIAYNYIRNIKIHVLKHNYNSSDEIMSETQNEFILLNSF